MSKRGEGGARVEKRKDKITANTRERNENEERTGEEDSRKKETGRSKGDREKKNGKR